jgi:hypothetical protein
MPGRAADFPSPGGAGDTVTAPVAGEDNHVWRCTTPPVLTMPLVNGVRVDHVAGLTGLGIDPGELLKLAVHACPHHPGPRGIPRGPACQQPACRFRSPGGVFGFRDRWPPERRGPRRAAGGACGPAGTRPTHGGGDDLDARGRSRGPRRKYRQPRTGCAAHAPISPGPMGTMTPSARLSVRPSPTTGHASDLQLADLVWRHPTTRCAGRAGSWL